MTRVVQSQPGLPGPASNNPLLSSLTGVHEFEYSIVQSGICCAEHTPYLAIQDKDKEDKKLLHTHYRKIDCCSCDMNPCGGIGCSLNPCGGCCKKGRRTQRATGCCCCGSDDVTLVVFLNESNQRALKVDQVFEEGCCADSTPRFKIYSGSEEIGSSFLSQSSCCCIPYGAPIMQVESKRGPVYRIKKEDECLCPTNEYEIERDGDTIGKLHPKESGGLLSLCEGPTMHVTLPADMADDEKGLLLGCSTYYFPFNTPIVQED